MNRHSLLFSKLVLILIFLLPANLLYAQYKFEHFTKTSGISNSVITGIIKDSKGYLWFGTEEGLNKFNGIEFTVYKNDPLIKNSIGANVIRCFYEDSKGRLWIGTQGGGLNLYNREKDNFTKYLHDEKNSGTLTDNRIKAIAGDAQGNLWIGTACSGLNKFNPETGELIPFVNSKDPRSLSSNCIEAIAIDKAGIIWLATSGGGLNAYDPVNNNFKSYFNLDKSPQDDPDKGVDVILCLTIDENGNIWMGTAGKGIVKLNPKTDNFQRYQISNSKSGEVVTGLCFISPGSLWVTTSNGLHIFDTTTEKFQSLYNDKNDPESLSTNKLLTIYKDYNNIVWLGTEDNGISKYDINKIKFQPFEKVLNLNYQFPAMTVYTICEDKHNNLCLATNVGLFRINKNNKSVDNFEGNKTKAAGLLTNDITAFAYTSNNTYWLGTRSDGITMFQDTLFKYARNNQAFKDLHIEFPDKIQTLYISKKNDLWIGTENEGLFQYNMDRYILTKYKLRTSSSDLKGITSDNVQSILEVSGGKIWIGTQEGLNIYDPVYTTFKHYKSDFNKKNSLNSNSILCIFEDSKKRIWLGTDNGLNLYEPSSDSFLSFNGTISAVSNIIYSILEDNDGSLWMGTSNGLIVLDPDKKNYISYDTKVGLNSNLFCRGSAYKSSDGTMYFGNNQGIVAVNPKTLRSNTQKFSLYITDLKLFNKSVKIDDTENQLLTKDISQTEELTLKYDQNVISFDFAALCYTLSEKNRYAYMLEPFEKDWNYVNTKHSTTYTNLNPGDYVFKVKAINSDGVWSEKDISLKITVLPPFWQTWWFRILVFLVIAGAAIGFYFYKLNEVREQNRVLEQKVQERTKELNDANVFLKKQKEEISQQAEELKVINDALNDEKQKVEKAYRNSQALSEIGQKITAQLNENVIHEIIYHYVSSLMPSNAFGIGYYVPEKHIIEFDDFREEGKVLPRAYIPLDDKNSLTGWVIRNKKSLFVNNLTQEYKSYVNVLKFENQLSASPESVIILPLMVEERIIGSLNLYSFSKNAFSDNDLSSLSTLASYIAIALDNTNVYSILNLKNENIKSSIRYAQTLQRAILPLKTTIDSYFDSFIVYRPKDIVSGDFYWFNTIQITDNVKKTGKEIIFASVIDCTGHGVPGAFMSVIGYQLLKEIIINQHIHEPNLILHALNDSIIQSLNQTHSKNNDGMDLCICRLERNPDKTTRVVFAGAKNPIFYYSQEEQKVKKVRTSSHSIGGSSLIHKKPHFENQEVILKSNDLVYLISDGIIDLNNDRRERFGTNRWMELINIIGQEPLTEQKFLIEKTIDGFNSLNEQRDDITVFGIKL